MVITSSWLVRRISVRLGQLLALFSPLIDFLDSCDFHWLIFLTHMTVIGGSRSVSAGWRVAVLLPMHHSAFSTLTQPPSLPHLRSCDTLAKATVTVRLWTLGYTSERPLNHSAEGDIIYCKLCFLYNQVCVEEPFSILGTANLSMYLGVKLLSIPEIKIKGISSSALPEKNGADVKWDQVWQHNAARCGAAGSGWGSTVRGVRLRTVMGDEVSTDGLATPWFPRF